MNKLTKGLLTVSLAAMIVGTAAACGGGNSDSWKGTDFTDYGAVKIETNGGFVAETANYVYFINGIESSSSDNTYGTPIKGALVAAKKTDLNDSQVVIPELMTASDYGAGVYIFGEGEETYAYYGTPNREKTSSGAVASSKMTFTRTRLDGKKNEQLFTVSSFSVNYRIAQAANGTVYIVYYDADSTSLISYNCTTKKSAVIAKTDAKTNETEGDSGEYLSLGEYKFLDNGNGAQVAYTMTVYTQKYYAAQEEDNSSYSRQTANYNYMYLYTAGENPACIKNGKTAEETYTLKSTVKEYLFYTAKPFGGNEKTYGVKLSAPTTATEIFYSENIKDGMIIKSYDEVYYLDTDAKKIIKNTLVKTDTVDEYNTKVTLLQDETISSLVDIDANYIYCFNTDGYIVAVERAGEGRTIRVSERTASASWYTPEKIKDTGYLLYCDSSTEGNSYIHYANVDDLSDENKIIKEDTDDDGENDLYYLASSFIGYRPAAGRAAVVSSKINAIETPLELEKGNDDKYTADSVKKARAAYDALDDDAKANVSDTDVKKLTNAEKALALADAFAKLEKVVNYNNLTEDEKTALKSAYDDAKKIVDGYGDDYTDIAAYLGDKLNLNYYYQQAGKKLYPAE
ncbi:MAG: hypothetical protein IJQ23_01555 [Clostridia bacterium]|nr:hypothetical protein [Clostridia bacterium]